MAPIPTAKSASELIPKTSSTPLPQSPSQNHLTLTPGPPAAL